MVAVPARGADCLSVKSSKLASCELSCRPREGRGFPLKNQPKGRRNLNACLVQAYIVYRMRLKNASLFLLDYTRLLDFGRLHWNGTWITSHFGGCF